MLLSVHHDLDGVLAVYNPMHVTMELPHPQLYQKSLIKPLIPTLFLCAYVQCRTTTVYFHTLRRHDSGLR